jgi:hypothetical protein
VRCRCVGGVTTLGRRLWTAAGIASQGRSVFGDEGELQELLVAGEQ